MPVNPQVFDDMKTFIGFSAADVDNLRELAPVFAKHGGTMTDTFYETLGRTPSTAKQIEGRVAVLKATHARWMGELFAGEYGEAYMNNRLRIGLAHVRIGLDPQWVEGVMSYLRVAGQSAILSEVADTARASALIGSYLRILDLDLMLINVAYAEERLDRLTKFTGMSRKLLENCIRKG